MSDYTRNELILEIFKRLPTKSLLRFRSVSKSLCSTIYSPEFIRTHMLQSPPKVLIRHRYAPDYKDFYTLHSEDQLPMRHSGRYNDETTFEVPYNHYYNIVGSCNGIICVYEYGGLFSL